MEAEFLTGMVGLQILPGIAFGILLGLIETIFVAKDESGLGWVKHAVHAFPFAVVFAIISMNVSWVLNFFGLGAVDNFAVDLGVRVLIAIVAMVKIKAAAAIAASQGESWGHIIVIGILLLAAPYIWIFLVGLGVIPSFLLLF